MNTAQKTTYVLDKKLDMTAKVGNSLWMYGFIGSTVMPVLAPVAAVGGAVFLASKALKIVNATAGGIANVTVRNQAQEQLKEIADKLDATETFKEIKTIIQSNGGEITKETMGKIMDKLNTIKEALIDENGNSMMGDVLKLIAIENTAAEGLVDNIQGALTDAVNIVNWGLTIYGAGGMMGAIADGGSMSSSGQVFTDQFSTSFDSGGSLEAQLHGSGIETTGMSDFNIDINRSASLAGDQGTEYLMFQMESDGLNKSSGFIRDSIKNVLGMTPPEIGKKSIESGTDSERAPLLVG